MHAHPTRAREAEALKPEAERSKQKANELSVRETTAVQVALEVFVRLK